MTYKKACTDLQQSIHKEETLLQTSKHDSPKKDPPKKDTPKKDLSLTDSTTTEKTENNDCNISAHDKVALQVNLGTILFS